MNILKGLTILSLLSVTLACKESGYKLENTLTPDKLLTIPIDNSTINNSFATQFFAENFFAMYNAKMNSIQIYDINSSKLIRNIKLYKEGDNQTSGYGINFFYFKSNDSVAVISTNPTYIYLLNSKDSLIKKIDYSTIYGQNLKLLTLPDLGHQPQLIGNKLYLLHTIGGSFDKNFKLTQDNINRTKTTYSVDLNTDSGKLYDFTYPKEFINDKCLLGINVLYTLGENNLHVYKFTYENFIFTTYDHKTFKKYELSTSNKNFPYRDLSYSMDMYKSMKTIIESNEYVHLIYDKNKNIYYLFVRKSLKCDSNTDIKTEARFPRCSILVLNTKFSLIGVVDLEDNRFNVRISFVNKEGLFISEGHPSNSNFNEDQLSFRLFKLEKI